MQPKTFDKWTVLEAFMLKHFQWFDKWVVAIIIYDKMSKLYCIILIDFKFNKILIPIFFNVSAFGLYQEYFEELFDDLLRKNDVKMTLTPFPVILTLYALLFIQYAWQCKMKKSSAILNNLIWIISLQDKMFFVCATKF